MNDFTKEELQHIGYCVSAVPIDDVTLIYKIKSMIDNHCEHEPSDTHYDQFKWQLCSKCGEEYK